LPFTRDVAPAVGERAPSAHAHLVGRSIAVWTHSGGRRGRREVFDRWLRTDPPRLSATDAATRRGSAACAPKERRPRLSRKRSQRHPGARCAVPVLMPERKRDSRRWVRTVTTDSTHPPE